MPRAAEASITPGRSLLAKAMGRSMEAGGEDHRWGAHLPQPVARHAGEKQCRIMIRHALEQHEEVVVPVADDGRVVQHMDVFGGQLVSAALPRGPVRQRMAIDGAARDIGETAQARVLVRDDDLRTLMPAAASAAASPAMPPPITSTSQLDVDLLIAVRVAAFKRLAQSCRAADEWFEDMLPEGAGHEGLVVETAGMKREAW